MLLWWERRFRALCAALPTDIAGSPPHGNVRSSVAAARREIRRVRDEIRFDQAALSGGTRGESQLPFSVAPILTRVPLGSSTRLQSDNESGDHANEVRRASHEVPVIRTDGGGANLYQDFIVSNGRLCHLFTSQKIG